QGTLPSHEEALLDRVGRVKAVEPGEDLGRVRERLTGDMVKGGGDVVGIKFVDAKPAHLYARVLVRRVQQRLACLILLGARGGWWCGGLLLRDRAGRAHGNVLVRHWG